MSPASTAECLRAVFAANLLHQGLVHDAIACASFLKSHPNLPKQVESIVFRGDQVYAFNLLKYRESNLIFKLYFYFLEPVRRHLVEIFAIKVSALEESWNA